MSGNDDTCQVLMTQHRVYNVTSVDKIKGLLVRYFKIDNISFFGPSQLSIIEGRAIASVPRIGRAVIFNGKSAIESVGI